MDAPPWRAAGYQVWSFAAQNSMFNNGTAGRHGWRLVSTCAEFGFAKLRKLKIRMDADF
jgi:hypothetical protein